MIEWLVSWGRAFVIFGALAMIVTGVVIGWYLGAMLDRYAWNMITAPRIIGSIVGFLFGSGIAGTVFGVVAAIFDIQENIRAIARAGGSGENLSAYVPSRREPSFESN